MNRAERRAAKRCKHRRTEIKPISERAGIRICLDCGRENRVPVPLS